MQSKVAVIFGKFLPLHLGHINFINRCYCETERLYLVVCYSDRDNFRCTQAGIPIITPEQRWRWLQQIYSDFENIRIVSIDETNISEYPNGWNDFAQLLQQVVPESFDTIFSSELEYDAKIKELFPNVKHCIVDPHRELVNISATRIRNNPLEHWGYLPSVVRPTFVKKVVLVGTASSGKTTMTRMLAKMYNTSWVEEYGRTYIYEQLGGSESGLSHEDFFKIAIGHKQIEDQTYRTANKIVFIDTEAIVTQFYHQIYSCYTDSAIDEIIKRQKYDLWLYLDNDVPWIEDGMRLNGLPTQRTIHKTWLMNLLTKYGVTTSGNFHIIQGSYSQRLNKSIELVQKLIE